MSQVFDSALALIREAHALFPGAQRDALLAWADEMLAADARLHGVRSFVYGLSVIRTSPDGAHAVAHML